MLPDRDDWIDKPTQPGDGRFHQAISEFLYEWARLHGPGFQAVRVIGDQRSARSRELRDLLSRNSIPIGFYYADSEQDRRPLASAGATGERLQAVVLFDGRVLVDPSNAAVADALGVRTPPRGRHLRRHRGRGGPGRPGRGGAQGPRGAAHTVPEPEAIGGQAGTSSKIRNDLGFPGGVSGAELAERTYQQAWSFVLTSSTASALWTFVPPELTDRTYAVGRR